MKMGLDKNMENRSGMLERGCYPCESGSEFRGETNGTLRKGLKEVGHQGISKVDLCCLHPFRLRRQNTTNLVAYNSSNLFLTVLDAGSSKIKALEYSTSG